MQVPEQVSNISLERLTQRGYVFWRCGILKGEIIAVVKGGGFYQDRAIDTAREAIKKGKLTELPVVYTREELRILCEHTNILLFHAAKKEGATLENGDSES